MRRITPALAAVGTAVLVTVAGCGSQGAPAESLGTTQKVSAVQALQVSAQKAAEVTSYRADLVADITGTKEGSGTVRGTVALQQKPDLATDVSLDELTFGGQSVPGGMRVILQGQTVYIKMELLKTLTGSTKPWIKVDLGDAAAGSGLDVQQLLGQAQQVDLQTSVKMLTSSKDAKVVGTETVGGVETTHYAGTFKAADALKLFDAEAQEKVRQSLYEAQDLKFDVWVDGDSLPRKLTLAGAAAEGKVDVTMLFKAFNEPLRIEAPPADQVGEISKGAKAGLGG